MIGFKAIGKRQDCELLEPLKLIVATAGATRGPAALARPVALAARVLGIVAALLIALLAACTDEIYITPPPPPSNSSNFGNSGNANPGAV